MTARGVMQVMRGVVTVDQSRDGHKPGSCTKCQQPIVMHPYTLAYRTRLVKSGITPAPLVC